MKNLRKTLRSAVQRKLSVPLMTQAKLSRRWRVDSDTARNLLDAYRIPKVPGPWRQVHYSMRDIWRIEGINISALETDAQVAALMEPLLTANDLANHYGVTATTIRDWARNGNLPSVKLGGSVRFHPHLALLGVPDEPDEPDFGLTAQKRPNQKK